MPSISYAFSYFIFTIDPCYKSPFSDEETGSERLNESSKALQSESIVFTPTRGLPQ